MTRAAILVLAMAATLVAQEKKQEMVVSKPEDGISMQKPNDEKWKVQSDGRMWKESICVNHIIDDLSAEANAQYLADGTKWPDGGIKEIGKGQISSFREETKPKEKDKEPNWKEFKVVKEDEKAKFPGGPGVGSAQAYYIEAIITYKDDSQKELRMWIFFKNNALFKFIVLGNKGEYEKKAKDMAFIMSAFRIFKREKKK